MKEFLQRTVAALMVAVYSLSVAPASELALTYQAGRRTLDAYLERAEVQGDREKFEKIAEQGIGAAIAEWEQNSLELKISDYDEWLLQKDALQEDLQNRKELSFEAWTLKKQTEEKAAMQKTALYDELRKAALEFSFKKADNSTTRIVSQEFIGQAKEQWNEIADKIVQRYIDEWFSENSGAEFLRNEFLSLETSITNSLVNALLYDHASLKKLSDAEAAAVIAQQLADDIDAQTSDSMNRLFDSMQTQVESVDENAASGGSEKEWLSRFEKELEAGLAKWDEAERSFLNARVEWEQNAENIFINDNQKWMEAYNELEKRKSQWAEKIEKQIEEGKAKWKAKNANLEKEIAEYMDELRNKLALETEQKQELVDAAISTYNQCREILVMAQSGITNWYARWGEKYNGIYSYWKTEDDGNKFGMVSDLNLTSAENLKNEIANWQIEFTKIAQSIVDEYCGKTKKQYTSITVPFGSEVPEDVIKRKQEEKNEWKNKWEDAKDFREEIYELSENPTLENLVQISQKMYSKKDEIKNRFPSFYSDIGKSVWECFDSKGETLTAVKEVFEWFNIYEDYSLETEKYFGRIYSLTGGGIENSQYNEIENERIKLKALESYWQDRTKIAQSVYDYSKNFSSNLEAAEKTRNNLDNAQREYQTKNSEYQYKLYELSLLKTKIEDAKEKYFEAFKAAEDALEKVKKAREEYDAFFEQWMVLNENKSFETLFSLNCELEKFNLDDYSYEYLIKSYYDLQETEMNKRLSSSIKKIKDFFENGFSTDSMSEWVSKEELEECGIYEIPETRLLSNAQINSLSNRLDVILASETIDFAAVNEILEDIKTIASTNCEIFETEVKKYNTAKTAAEKASASAEIEKEEADKAKAKADEAKPAMQEAEAAYTKAKTELDNAKSAAEASPGSISLAEKYLACQEKYEECKKEYEERKSEYNEPYNEYIKHNLEYENQKAKYEKQEKEKNEAYEKIEDSVSEMLKNCQDEINRRKAIFILLEGSLEEIEKTFSDNSKYEEIYKNYKKNSIAVLNKEQTEARSEVYEILTKNLYKPYDDFCDIVDSAKERLDDAGKCVLDCFKKALKDQNENKGKDATLMKDINTTFAEDNLVIKNMNFHIQPYLSFFADKNLKSYKILNDNSKDQTQDFSLLDVSESRAKILSKMRTTYTQALDVHLNKNSLNTAMEQKQAEIENAQNDYNEKIEKLRGENDISALKLYEAVCNEYNVALQETQNFYEVVEEKRRNYRLAEEIYFYAENEYLHGTTDVETPLIYARQKLAETRTALQALAEIEAEKKSAQNNINSCKEFNDFKESAKQYYKLRVLDYEYEEAVAAQKERLLKAQEEETAALNCIVCEWKDNTRGNLFEIPTITSDFINATKNSDGTFSFTLNSIEKINSRTKDDKEKSDSVLEEYYTDYCLTTEYIDGTEISISRAKQGAIDFIKSLENNEYSIEDLALAVLYLKMKGNDEQKMRWLKDGSNSEEGEDPNIPENYPVGDIPEEMHSVDIWKAYKDGRKIALQETYDKVLQNGGEQDIIKYILYSETNITSALNLYNRQHDTLSIRGFDYAIEKIESKVTELRVLAAVQMALASMYTAILCLPFCLGAWASPLLILATTTLIALTGAADKLEQVKSDIEDIQRGYEENSEVYQKSQNSILKAQKRASQKCQEEQESLNIMLYGKEENTGQKMTWEAFEKSLQKAIESNMSESNYSYFTDMHDSNSNNLKEFFNNITKTKDFTSTDEIITKMGSVLRKKYNETSETLNEYVNRKMENKEANSKEFYSVLNAGETKSFKTKLKNAASAAWGKDSFDKTQYNLTLASFYNEEILSTLPVRNGNETEKYIFDIFENMKDVYSSQLFDSDKAQIDVKQYRLDIIQYDSIFQYDSWLGKINSAKDIGIEEWYRADEKLNAAYNSWQKEWIEEYAKANEEWDSNYTEFLQDKQDWINESYLQTGIKDVQIKNYAAVSKIKTATNMSDSISEYVSSLYDAEKFLLLADFSNRLFDFIDNNTCDISIFMFDKADSSTLRNYDEMCKMQEKVESDMQKAAAKYQAENIQKNAEENIKNYFKAIKEQNEGIENWELEMVRKLGYSVDSEIHRNAIVDSTAFETVREKQTVHRYEYFSTQAPEISFDQNDYQGSSEYFIMRKSQELQNKIQDWQERIFGKKDSEGNSKTEGELQKHIGESPTFIENIDLTKSRENNIKNPGSGEMGLIMLDFQWNSMKNKQGYDELSKAIYDQKLTTSDSWFQLPTIREIVGIICDVLGNCGMVWFKYMDDALFGTLDVAMGYKSFEEVMNEGLKQGLISAASSAISSAGSAIFSSVGEKIGAAADSQILAATQKAAVGLANNVTSSYINAFDFSTGTMNWEQANSVWHNASTFTSVAGTMLGGALGEINNVDANGLRLNQGVFKNIEKMNGTIGNLSAAAMNYAFTGDISFNLASVNGVGLFEVGFKDGKFSAGISEGGTSFSLLNANLQQIKGDDGRMHLKASLNDNVFKVFAGGAKNAKQVADLKNGSLEDRSVKLNAANLLAWSGTENNIELGRNLFSGKQNVIFAELGDDKMLSAMDGDNIVLNSKFLSNDKNSQALIASLIAYENAAVSDSKFVIKNIDFSTIKKGDNTDYTAEEIENMKNKYGNDHTIGAMIDSSAAFVAAHDLLNSDYKSIENTEELAAFAKVYKERGAIGIFSVYAAAYEAEKNKVGGDYGAGGDDEDSSTKNEKNTNTTQVTKLTFKNVMKLGWYQNKDKNGNKENYDELLGFSMTKEDYNNLAKENAAERYANERLAELNLSEDSIKLTKEILIADALKDEDLLKQYGYKEQTDETTLAKYGCTLSTVAYIAYSITGKVVSLREANEILKKNNLFYSVTDSNGIKEKNLIGMGQGYVDAVNAIAGGNYLAMDGNQNTFSESNSSNIFNRIIANKYDKDNVYYTHLRINNGNYVHSVLLDSVSFINKNNPELSTLDIYNPWSGGWGGRTTIKVNEVNRADFYKLTKAGKDIYNLRRAFTEATTSKNEKYVKLQKSL